MKSESDFRRWFISQLRSDCDIVPIESTVSRGVPDLNLCRNGVECWVELKLFVGGRVLLRPEQFAWGMRRSAFGGRVFVVAWHRLGMNVWKFPTKIVPHGKYVHLTGLPSQFDHKNVDALRNLLFT